MQFFVTHEIITNPLDGAARTPRHVGGTAEGRCCATARALYATRPFTPEGVFLAVSLTVCYCGALA